jgi:hypothetical protein
MPQYHSPTMRRFLTIPIEQQPPPRLAHPGFHTLIWRILSTALKRNLNSGGLLSAPRVESGWKEPFLAQLSGGHIERKDKVARLPLKTL